jgi:hypothetical protein
MVDMADMDMADMADMDANKLLWLFNLEALLAVRLSFNRNS